VPGSRSLGSQSALAQVPATTVWAEEFCRGSIAKPARFVRDAAPSIVGSAVLAIAESATPDVDARLRGLLDSTITQCRAWAAVDGDEPRALAPEVWRDIVRAVPAAAV
jgi:hypothetical protein